VGILRRSAEGNCKHIFAIAGVALIAGLWMPVQTLMEREGWLQGKAVFLPDKFGWTGGVIVTLAVLTGFYFFISYMESRKK